MGQQARQRKRTPKERKGCPLSEVSRAPAAMPEAKSDLFRSLGHPVRIRVLELLADGPVRVSELRKSTDLEASNLSQHLGVLRRQQLIVSSRAYGQIHYRLSSPEILPLLAVAGTLLRSTLQSPACTCPRQKQVHGITPSSRTKRSGRIRS